MKALKLSRRQAQKTWRANMTREQELPEIYLVREHILLGRDDGRRCKQLGLSDPAWLICSSCGVEHISYYIVKFNGKLICVECFREQRARKLPHWQEKSKKVRGSSKGENHNL